MYLFFKHCCLWLISVSSISSPSVGILSCDDNWNKPSSWLVCGSTKGSREATCSSKSLLADWAMITQHRPQPSLLSCTSLPSHSSLSILHSRVLASTLPLPSVKLKLGGACVDTIVSSQLSVSNGNNNSSKTGTTEGGWQWRPRDPPRWWWRRQTAYQEYNCWVIRLYQLWCIPLTLSEELGMTSCLSWPWSSTSWNTSSSQVSHF